MQNDQSKKLERQRKKPGKEKCLESSLTLLQNFIAFSACDNHHLHDQEKSHKSESRATPIHLFRVIHFARSTTIYQSATNTVVSGLLEGRRCRLFDDRWRCASTHRYSWYYTVHETGSRRVRPYESISRSHSYRLAERRRGEGDQNHWEVGDYEILSQHLVRLIRPDRSAMPHRSVIQTFKEIHVLTHVTLRRSRYELNSTKCYSGFDDIKTELDISEFWFSETNTGDNGSWGGHADFKSIDDCTKIKPLRWVIAIIIRKHSLFKITFALRLSSCLILYDTFFIFKY